jgi:hypothetical protein
VNVILRRYRSQPYSPGVHDRRDGRGTARRPPPSALYLGQPAADRVQASDISGSCRPETGCPAVRDDLDFENNLVSVEEFEATDIRPRFYHEVFVLGLPLKETSEFKFHMENIARRGRSWKEVKSEDEVLRFLESKVRIFEEIRRSGEVRTSQEITGKRRDEIGCLIDHRGRLVKGHNGNNRFSIARMLRLPSGSPYMLMPSTPDRWRS